MPGEESRRKLQSPSAFDITSIRNNIIQKIQQSVQHLSKEELEQSTQVEGHLVQTAEGEGHSVQTAEGEGHSVQTAEGERHLIETAGGEECLARNAQAEEHLVQTPEAEGHLAQSVTDEEHLVQTAQAEGHLVQTTQGSQDDKDANTQEFIESNIDNAAVKTSKDADGDTSNTVTLTAFHSTCVHPCTAADLELASNVSYTLHDQTEHEDMEDFGAEPVADLDRQVHIPAAAARCSEGEVGYNVAKVVTCGEALEDRKRQQSDSEIILIKEKYRTHDRGLECNGEDATSSDSDADSSSSSVTDQEQDVIAKIRRDKGNSSEEEAEKAVNKSCEGFEEIRTAGEVFPEELPPIEELKIDVDANTQLEEVGQVSGVVGVLVVIHSRPGHSPVQDDTVFFLEDRMPIGQVFEVFGPVVQPYYSIRFNTSDDIEKRGIKVGTLVYFAPEVPELTHYVFVERLKRLKGSDASWKDNNEPPPEMVDYSDDEEERRAKAKRRSRGASQVKDGQAPPDDSSPSVPAADSSTPVPVPGIGTCVPVSCKQPRNWRKKSEKDSSQTSSASNGCWPPSYHSSKRFSENASGILPTPSVFAGGPDPVSRNPSPCWRASGPGVLRGPMFSPPSCRVPLGPRALPAIVPPHHSSLPEPSFPYYNFTHIPPPPSTLPASQGDVHLRFGPQTAATFGARPSFIQGPLQHVRPPAPWNPGFPPLAPCSSDHYPQGDWSHPAPFTAPFTAGLTQNGQQQFTAQCASWALPPGQQEFTAHSTSPGHKHHAAHAATWTSPGHTLHTRPACRWGRQELPNTTSGLCGKTSATPILDQRLINSSQS